MNARILPVILALAGILLQGPAAAQWSSGTDGATLTVEAYGNASAGADAGADESLFFDGALRTLGLLPVGAGGRIGARAVIEAYAGDGSDVELGERSLLWVDRWGRLEYGRRQGLPDILVGYGPNNFTFTSAEYGPASGLSLDPAGGLTSVFLGADGPQAPDLSHLGFAAALSGDRSEKVIYVSPKWAGFLGGVSYASDGGASRDGVGELVQLGLTRERYVGDTVLRFGGSLTQAVTADTPDLRSINAGFSALLHDTWLIGIGAGYDDGGGMFRSARGVVTSLNYNRAAWTFGGFLQFASADPVLDSTVDPMANAMANAGAGDAAVERLRVGQIGLSYRTSRQVRWFAAYERRRTEARSGIGVDAGVLIVGLRTTL